MKLSRQVIKKMMQSIKATQEYELSCDHCFDEVDQFIEMELSGKNAAEAMPLVRQHLDRCGGCREEYEVLLEALKTMIDRE